MNSMSLSYLRTFLTLHADRFRDHRASGELGASAVELAVISAVIVGIAILLLGLVHTFVNNTGTKLDNTNVPNN